MEGRKGMLMISGFFYCALEERRIGKGEKKKQNTGVEKHDTFRCFIANVR